MDDIKRPPKNTNLASNGTDPKPSVSSKTGPISQTSGSLNQDAATKTSRTAPNIDPPKTTDKPPAPKEPVSLDQLDGEQPKADKPADKPASPEEVARQEPKPAQSATAVDSSPHVYDPSSSSSQSIATKPESKPSLSSNPQKPEAVSNDVKSPAASEPYKSSVQTKAGNIPTTELPPPPDLSDSKKGKVSKAPTDHPKRKFNWMVVIIALVLALALAGGAGYAYWQSQQQPTNTTPVVERSDPEEEDSGVSAEDIDNATSDIDKALQEIEETDEVLNSDLTDQGLEL